MKRFAIPKSALVFYLLSSAGILFSLALAYRTHGAAIAGMSTANSDTFMDFFNHIAYARTCSEVYSTSPHANFPPLIYIFYHILFRLLPDGSVAMFNPAATAGNAYLYYVIYCCALCVLLYACINAHLHARSGVEKLWLALLLIFSAPFFLGVLMTGNAVSLVLLLLLAAALLRESDRWYLRELALILVAAAAGCKIYACVFGLLYLAERRYREALRLMAYGLLAFFVPFIWFGGVNGFLQFWNNLHTINAGTIGNPLPGINGSIFASVQLPLQNSGMESARLAWAGYIGVTVCAALSLVALFMHQTTWKRLVLLAGMMCFLPIWSGYYTLCVFVLPLTAFLADPAAGARGPASIAYAVLFALCFTLIAVPIPAYESAAGPPAHWLVRYLGAYGLFFSCMFEGMYSAICRLMRAVRHRRPSPA